MEDPIPQVGAPDPELDNSPILDETECDEQAGSRDVEIERGACYFNGKAYPIGARVRSGNELLECTEGGVWAIKGEKEGPGDL